MANGKTYSDETKAAVMAALLAGQSVSSIAKEYQIPKGTVSGWKEKAQGVVNQTTQKKESGEIGEALLRLLTTEIETLTQLSLASRDVTWVHKQSAADLAVFAGVKQDKLMRMLEAFGKSDDSSTATDDSDG